MSFPIRGGSAMWEVQKALFRVLTTDLSILEVCPKVYDVEPPPEENPALPYIVIGEVNEIPRDVLTASGRELALTVHVWSDYQGAKQVKQIAERLALALDQKPDALNPMSGWACILLQIQMNEMLPEFGAARQLVMRFRAQVRAQAK
jgi:hypothetical protein